MKQTTKPFLTNKRGMMTFQTIPVIILALVVSAAIGVAGFLALDGLDNNLTANSEGFNATANITVGMGNIFDFAPTWGTLVGVGILIGIVLLSFGIGAVGYAAAKNRGYL